MKRIFLVALTITFISGTSSYGQNPYIGSNSVGKVSKPDDAITKQGLRFRPMTSWVGERFIFLPTSKLLQTYGYQSFGLGVSYSDHVGRIAKVTKIDVGDAEEYTV